MRILSRMQLQGGTIIQVKMHTMLPENARAIATLVGNCKVISLQVFHIWSHDCSELHWGQYSWKTAVLVDSRVISY